MLALGTAVAAILNFTILYGYFHRTVIALEHKKTLFHLMRVVLAAATMGVAVHFSHELLASLLDTASIRGRAVAALSPIVVGALVYAAASALFRVEEVSHYWARLRRR